jgi:hypothetical protein
MNAINPTCTCGLASFRAGPIMKPEVVNILGYVIGKGVKVRKSASALYYS